MKDNKDFEEDYDKARETYNELMQTGKVALQLSANIAQETEHPKALEAIGKLMKDVSDICDKSIKLHKDKKIIEDSDADDGIINGSINKQKDEPIAFIGTTTDLQRNLADNKIIDVPSEDIDES